MVGNPDEKVAHQCASQENVGRLAGLKVRHDLGSPPSPLFVILSFVDCRSTLRDLGRPDLAAPSVGRVMSGKHTNPLLCLCCSVGCAWGDSLPAGESSLSLSLHPGGGESQVLASRKAPAPPPAQAGLGALKGMRSPFFAPQIFTE